ncbi:membrane protein insertion efficiency factor YidD [bacterium]|nr:membrane protein insertion efficiency factor YidD [bacterium]
MLKKIVLKLIKIYQGFISPLLGRHCRFYPSCSNYCYLSIKKYGLSKGLYKGVRRILKCHSLSKGGIDLP